MPARRTPMEDEHVIVLLEDMQSNLGLIVEIRDSLRAGMDRLHEDIGDVRRELHETRDDLKTRIESLRGALKPDIAAVATDLAGHRADTESHAGRGYNVAEQ